MPAELKQLFDDLDKATLRIGRPTKFIFLCGGRTDEAKPNVPISLRQYLLNEKRIGARIEATVVLAEKATKLYRDTDYEDLISFEEDIAQLSATVLVITESAGSLAELGAFAGNLQIRPHVSLISQTKYVDEESFVRFGPIQRIRGDDEDRVSFVPWLTNKKDLVVKSSVAPHVSNIVAFINDVVAKKPEEELYSSTPALHLYIHILWLMHFGTAMALTEIQTYYKETFAKDLTQSTLRNALFCMKLAGWVDQYSYINKTYWYAVHDKDPLKYRYLAGVRDNDTLRRKVDIVKAIRTDLRHPTHVMKHVTSIKLKTDDAA